VPGVPRDGFLRPNDLVPRQSRMRPGPAATGAQDESEARAGGECPPCGPFWRAGPTDPHRPTTLARQRSRPAEERGRSPARRSAGRCTERWHRRCVLRPPACRGEII
jgi:hypothetical protein